MLAQPRSAELKVINKKWLKPCTRENPKRSASLATATRLIYVAKGTTPFEIPPMNKI